MKRMFFLIWMLPAAIGVTGVNAQDSIDSLLIGGQPTPEMLGSLASDGYEAVLSTRGVDEIDWDEKSLVDSLGMTFMNIPMPHPVTEITDEQLEQFEAFMSTGKRSFIHCGSGNRVAGLWAAWLIGYQDMDPVEAFARAEAQGMRPGMRDVVEKRVSAGKPTSGGK